jgi:MFS family permease
VSLLYVGRFAAGVCSGAAFASGTAQIKELSSAPYDPSAGEQAGARRAAIALSGGFGLGALVAGLVAQWAPDPLVVAYLPHLIVMAITMPLLIGAPETIVSRQPVPDLRTILRVPSAGHTRFRRIVAPAAPWVFAAPSISFAVLPGLVSHQTGSFEVGFAALIAGLTLAVGVLIQPLARRLDAVGDVRGTLTGLTAVTAGVVLGAWCGYGLCLVSGLLEIQRLASHEDLASLTAVFYALTYIGFAAPIVLAELERLTSATVLLVCVAGVAAFTAVEVAVAGSVSFRPKQR